MIEAKIVADSIAPSNVRLTTFVLTYPRFIHAEFMTHRVFSRNASSSRAIPVAKLLKEVWKNPASPIAFQANKTGMQGGEYFPPWKQLIARAVWKLASVSAIFWGKILEKLNVHKQYANRITEPFAHITVVVTATEWSNFFALRYHHMAQPEIAELAKKMWEAYSNKKPTGLGAGIWHLPFIKTEDVTNAIVYLGHVFPKTLDKEIYEFLAKISVARCARVSYLNHDGTKSTLAQDLQLYDRLLGNSPIHASPAEHQAQAVSDPNYRSGNFRGWIQYRKTLANENVIRYNGPTEG